MQRSILAYDAGCSSCSKVAAQVAGDHRLEVKGLHDPEVRLLLDGARPEWRFQPTLICVEGERVEVFTGPSMAARLVILVGPRKAGKLVKALGQEASADGATRRTVLARGLMATGAVLVGGAAAATPAGARSSIDAVDAALAGRIERLGAVQRASRHLGEVQRITFSPGRPNIYLLEHVKPHSFSAVDEDVRIALSYQIGTVDGDPVVDYLEPDGQLIVRRNLRAGKAEAAHRTAVASVVPTPDVGVQCGQFCFYCVTPQHEAASQRTANCVACGVCAGRDGVRCARSCLGSGGPSNFAFCLSVCINQIGYN